MILYINNEYCNSVKQLKDYFGQDINVGSDIYTDLLDYGRSGDIAKWLREQGYESLADKVDSIVDNGDADYIKKLGEALTGSGNINKIPKRPFSDCFEFQNTKCEVYTDHTIVKLIFKVLMVVNETYNISVDNQCEHVNKCVNSIEFEEGSTVTMSFVLHQHKPGNRIAIKVEDEELSKCDLKSEILAINNENDYYSKKYISDQEAYRAAKEKLNAIQKIIRENSYHGDEAYNGFVKEEEIINEYILPLVRKGHKAASQDYYWYLFVRSDFLAEKLKKEFEEKHVGEKLIDTPLTDDQLFEKVQEMFSIVYYERSKSLRKADLLGRPSEEYVYKFYEKNEQSIYNNYIKPLAKKGHRGACLKYYNFLYREDPVGARLFLNDYRNRHPGDDLVEHANFETAIGIMSKIWRR